MSRGSGNTAPLVHVSQDFLLIAARKEERILPSSVVRDALKEKVEEIEAEQTRQYFYDVGQRTDQIYYGALDVDLSPDTTLGVGLAYEDVDATPCWGGLPRYADGSDLKLKRSTCLNPAWNHQRGKPPQQGVASTSS